MAKISSVPHYSSLELFGYFALSIVLNSLGNALTVAMNLGSALWTASAVNLHAVTPLSLSWLLFLEGVLVIIVNIIILRRFEWNRIIGNLIFMVPFSYLVQFFAVGVAHLLGGLPLWSKVIVDCFGICLIGTAISLYQRVNWWMHPVDDMTQIIRFRYLKGSAWVSQLVTFAAPTLAIIVIFIATHHMQAVNVGTIFALLFQGAIVGWADRHIFPRLIHRSVLKEMQQAQTK